MTKGETCVIIIAKLLNKRSEYMMLAIKKLRLAANLSQASLADKLGVTQGALSQWERGESLPSSDKLPKIAEVLNCTVKL